MGTNRQTKRKQTYKQTGCIGNNEKGKQTGAAVRVIGVRGQQGKELEEVCLRA